MIRNSDASALAAKFNLGVRAKNESMDTNENEKTTGSQSNVGNKFDFATYL